MSDARGASRWTEEQLHLGAVALYNADQQVREPERWSRDMQKVRAVLDAVFPVGEPDGWRCCACGHVSADATHPAGSECGLARAGLDSWVGEPDDERLDVEQVKKLVERMRSSGSSCSRFVDEFRAAVAAVRAAGPQGREEELTPEQVAHQQMLDDIDACDEDD